PKKKKKKKSSRTKAKRNRSQARRAKTRGAADGRGENGRDPDSGGGAEAEKATLGRAKIRGEKIIFAAACQLSKISKSAKSCGRPTARLFWINASLPRMKTGMPSSSAETLLANASSVLTPLMLLSRSIRFGARPSWITWFGSVKSDSRNPEWAKPNSFSRSTIVAAFFDVARIRMSRPPV